MRGRSTALVLLGLLTGVAHAGLFDDEEARARVNALNNRVEQMQRTLDTRLVNIETAVRNQAAVDLVNQFEMLRSDLAKLRGQIEVLGYEVEQAQKRQRDLYVDLDSRIRKIESMPTPVPAAPAGSSGSSGSSAAPAVSAAPPASPGGAGAVSAAGTAASPTAASGAGQAGSSTPPAAPRSDPAPTNVVSIGNVPPLGVRSGTADIAAEQRAYDTALDQFKTGNYIAATTGFQGFVRTYPRSPLAPSAQYWIGNAQFALKDYRGAITSQRALIGTYPDSQKVPDALLNIASSQAELGDGTSARRTLEEVVAKYPASEAADKARRRLTGAR